MKTTIEDLKEAIREVISEAKPKPKAKAKAKKSTTPRPAPAPGAPLLSTTGPNGEPRYDWDAILKKKALGSKAKSTKSKLSPKVLDACWEMYMEVDSAFEQFAGGGSAEEVLSELRSAIDPKMSGVSTANLKTFDATYSNGALFEFIDFLTTQVSLWKSLESRLSNGIGNVLNSSEFGENKEDADY